MGIPDSVGERGEELALRLLEELELLQVGSLLLQHLDGRQRSVPLLSKQIVMTKYCIWVLILEQKKHILKNLFDSLTW